MGLADLERDVSGKGGLTALERDLARPKEDVLRAPTGPFPGDMPWADTIKRWGEERPGLLGDVVRGLVPTTGSQTAADVALAPIAGAKTLGPLGRLATSLVKSGVAGTAGATGEAATGGDSPGAAFLRHAIPTGLTEGGLRFAERFVAPRVQDMWRFGTPNPRAASRAAAAEERAGQVAARKTAREQTEALEKRAAEDAKIKTEALLASTKATRDVAEQMRLGTHRGQIAAGMSRVVPELEAGAEELYGAAYKWGKPQLDRVFESTMKEVSSRIDPTRQFRIPQLNDGRALSFDEARTALAELGTGIGRAGRTVRSAQQAYTAVDYRKARDELQRQLNRADVMAMLPGARPDALAGDVWADAMSARGAGRAYLGVLQQAIDPKTGMLDPDKLRVVVNKNVEKLRERFGRAWDDAEHALLGGQRTPAPVSGPLKTPVVERIRPAAVTPVAPVYPPPRAPYSVSPTARAAATYLAQDPYVGATEMQAATGIPSQLWRWAHRLVP